MNFDVKLVKKSSFYLIGILFITFGVSLTYEGQALGVGAFDALNMGLSEASGRSVGFWVNVCGITLLSVDAIIRRGMPNFMALIPMLLIGTLIDFWMGGLLANVQPDPGLGELCTLILGMITIAFGLSLYLQPKLPPAPIDVILVTVSSTFKLSFGISKTIIEGTILIFAFIVGGPIGIGTIIITLCIGPTLQFFYPRAERLYNKFIG